MFEVYDGKFLNLNFLADNLLVKFVIVGLFDVNRISISTPAETLVYFWSEAPKVSW